MVLLGLLLQAKIRASCGSPLFRSLLKLKLDGSKGSDPSKPMEHSCWILCLHPSAIQINKPFLSSSFVFLYILDWICLFILITMGLLMSLARKGLPTTQVIDKVTDKFQGLFLNRDIDDLEKFHVAILDMFATVNSALPGKHFIVPPFHKIEECFENIKQYNEERKKEEVIQFLTKNIQPNKSDNTMLIIGLATPPAAMAAKKAGERVPPLKFIKSVPDVLFVPAATLLTLVSVKLSRNLFIQRAAAETI